MPPPQAPDVTVGVVIAPLAGASALRVKALRSSPSYWFGVSGRLDVTWSREELVGWA